MSETRDSERVTILGAGLAGGLAAVFLARRGHRVTVYEKRPDLRLGEISAGRSINLALAERGIVALRRAGLAERVEPLLTPMRGRCIHAPDGATSLQPYGQNPGELIYSVSRPGLNGILLDAAEEHGAELRFDQGATAVELCRGELTVADHAGRETTLPLGGAPLIGADGAGSVLRQAMAPTSTGGGVQGFVETIDPLAHSYKELTIPATAEGGHAIDREALHIWPRGGFMLIALPNLDGSFTVTLFLPTEPTADGTPSFAELHRPEAVAAFFGEHFADAAALIPSLVDDFLENPTGMLATVRCAPWNAGGQALLIGDAAHAVVPFHGQGMNCAFEDCAAIDAALEAAGGSGPRWERLFDRVARERKPNADAIADMALENYIEMRDSVRDPRFVLRKQLAFELERRFPARFIPRYSMVMFHAEIPYAEAQRRGVLQRQILEELTPEGVETVEAVDLTRAAMLIEGRLPPPPQRAPGSAPPTA